MLKELHVSFAPPEIQITDFEVAPEMASVVSLSAVIGEELECAILRNVFGVCLHELYLSLNLLGQRLSSRKATRTFDSVPKSLDGLAILRQRYSESIDLLVILHEQERVIVHVTVELDVGPVPRHRGQSWQAQILQQDLLDSPIVVVLLKEVVPEEELRSLKREKWGVRGFLR